MRVAVANDDVVVTHPPGGEHGAIVAAAGALIDVSRALGVSFDGDSVADVGAACVAAITQMQAANRELLKTQLLFQTLFQWGLR